jgi:hypothetical protein
MANHIALRCDGCGQAASPEHTARRLRRLEWATRCRPVHIQTLLLGGIAPVEDGEFLYAPGGEFRGEAALLLQAVGITFAGKAAEGVHAEFQAAGFFLTHLLECPMENGKTMWQMGPGAAELLREHLPSVAPRIRRSLKPKRVILVTEVPERILEDILALHLGCPVVLDEGKPFQFSSSGEEGSVLRLRAALAAARGN